MTQGIFMGIVIAAFVLGVLCGGAAMALWLAGTMQGGLEAENPALVPVVPAANTGSVLPAPVPAVGEMPAGAICVRYLDERGRCVGEEVMHRRERRPTHRWAMGKAGSGLFAASHESGGVWTYRLVTREKS